MEKRACIFVNGDLKDAEFYRSMILSCEIVIAADGAANSLKKMDITPDIIIGDMDSINDEVYSYYKNKKVCMLRYPVKKDKTDTELAIDEMAQRGYENVVMMGFSGGRTDHMLGNIEMCSYAASIGVNLKLKDEKTVISLVGKGITVIETMKKSIISFISYGGPAKIKRLTGLEYPLEDYCLKPGSTRCISNIALQDDPQVEIESGSILVIVSDNQAGNDYSI